VIQTLADVVSKNGNLLLNIPVRGDGTIDDDELTVVEGIADWMDVNRECIFGHPALEDVCGEGPAPRRRPAADEPGVQRGQGQPRAGSRPSQAAVPAPP
jgi:alpha-L-fucosidase